MASQHIRTILLATDLSATSGGAEAYSLDLARDLDATLIILSVIDPGPMRRPGGTWIRRMDQVRSEREASAQGLVARGRAMGIRVRFLIWEGDPAEATLEAAASERADLIVVGSHGRSGMNRLLLGSVSDRVAREAPVPVLIAREHPGATPDLASRPA